MNSCCTRYYEITDDTQQCMVLDSELKNCDECNCNCGYIQYESLAPYLTKLSNNNTGDGDHIILEAKLRQQIVEVSRLFDLETKVKPGTYLKGHTKVIKLYSDNTRYLKIPDFVENSLELYTENKYLINSSSYAYENGFLILNPCMSHTLTCGCTNSCGMYKEANNNISWQGCFLAKAIFGNECAPSEVQLAVRSYIIENNTYGDIKEVNFQGLPVSRGFRLPHSWSVAVQKYLEKKRKNNIFAFA